MAGIPTPCPCCGAYSLAPDANTTVLVAVADVLVTKALERVGAFIIRGSRTRYAQAEGVPLHVIHTIWRAPDEVTARALRGAWDVVPALINVHGCCGVSADDVARVLDEYVHDLVVTGTQHSVTEPGGLEYRFARFLGLPVGEWV